MHPFNEPSQSHSQPIPHVDEELLKRLHDANAGFHEARKTLEAVQDGSDFRHQERVDQAYQRLREAEGRVEEANKQIASTLHLPPATPTS
jgi:hypothetical protein